MANFEDLRLKDLIVKFREEIFGIYSSRSLKNLNKAGEKLQSVYNFYVSAQNSFTKQEELLKNLFSSFNYAAVLTNDAIKKGAIKDGDKELLNECFEIMLTCCDKINDSLV